MVPIPAAGDAMTRAGAALNIRNELRLDDADGAAARSGRNGGVTRTTRAFTALAIMAGAVIVAGAASLAIDRSRKLTEQQHTMTCLAAYVAFIQVMGSPEE